MKYISLILFLKSLSLFGQETNRPKLEFLDTLLCIHSDSNEPLVIDSVSFLMIDLQLDCKAFFNDDKQQHQNKLAQILKVSNVDTLVIEFFNFNYNILDLLTSFKNVNTIRLFSNDTLVLSGDIHNIDLSINSLELYASELIIDLAIIDSLNISNLWIDVFQEDQVDHISFLSTSQKLENLFISTSFSRKNKFRKRNKHRFINKKVIKIKDSSDCYITDKGSWPKYK